MASFNSAVIARAAAALYDVQLGNASMTWALNAVDSVTYGGSVAALVQDVYNRDFKSMTYAQVAAVVVKNAGVTTGAAAAETYVAGQLAAGGAGNEGATIVQLMNDFAGLKNHPVAAYNEAAKAFNAQINAAVAYAATTNTADSIVHLPVELGPNRIFNLEHTQDILGVADVMHLTGGQDVRIDFTNSANQVRGLDLDGDGVIETNGIENVSSNFDPSDRAQDYEIVDAYSRNPLNHYDSTNNFLGDIHFDGTGFKGDGVSTNGNVFLGGLGNDVAFGGIGNDFLAGGGVAENNLQDGDYMSGGRNADFFFAEFSGLDATDGSSLEIDGGNTADDNSAGNGQSAQDADWLLFEASDDDEPVRIWLNDDNVGPAEPGDGVNDEKGRVLSRSGESMVLDDVENIDASGNLYGFLNSLPNIQLGGRGTDDRDVAGSSNYGIGSSAQLNIVGSYAGNTIVAGYDNDFVDGSAGNDILFGGNLQQLMETVANGVTNVNLAGITTDGRDELYGGTGDDSVVLELDKGIADGGDGNDTLYITNYTVGRPGATEAASASAILADNIIRIDLGYSSYKGYRGDTLGENTDHSDEANSTSTSDWVSGTADQTVYKSTYAKTTVNNFENVIASGMGAIDYLAAGANKPDLKFSNEQNFYGTAIDLELRGTDGSTTVFTTTTTTTTTAADLTADQIKAIYADYVAAYEANGYNEGSPMSLSQFKTALTSGGLSLTPVTSTSTAYAYAVARTGTNTLYGGAGNDIIEGRSGDDKLSGRDGNDDFVFSLQVSNGDGVDVIHRQSQDPAKAANITDGKFERDFGLSPVTDAADSVLRIVIQKAGGNAAGDELSSVVNRVSEIVTGVKVDGVFQKITLATDAIKAATTYSGLVTAINAALDATPYGADLQATLQTDGVTIHITDTKSRELADTDAEVLGAGVSVSQKANTATSNEFEFGQPDPTITQDRIIYKAYENRAKNEGVDDDATLGSTVSLGVDSYANDLVIDFSADGTRLAEDQLYAVQLKDLAVEDKVTITINDVKYTLQVGVRLDGTLINNESNNAFVARMATYITTFLDDDTAAGKVIAAATGDTLQIWQQDYSDGEEVVFMRTPTVAIDNLSGGYKATSSVTNISQHEVLLYKFDGRDAALNNDNVLFVGEEFTNRAVLQTADNDAGGELLGSDAMVVFVANSDPQDDVTSSATEGLDDAKIGFNKDANKATLFTENFAVHGDDLLLGGDARDSIWAGTGDDRVHGSAGGTTSNPERLDGGKDLYLVDHEIRVLNDYEASQVDEDPDTISIEKILQTENGTGLQDAFQDTLIYQQRDFGDVGKGGAKFYIELSDDVERKEGGEGWVTTTEAGVQTGFTYFTNFEHIRTVSGDGTWAGQGDDTLDFADLSETTGGVFYNLSNNTATNSDNDWPDGPNLDAAGPGAVVINWGENWANWRDASEIPEDDLGVTEFPINAGDPDIVDGRDDELGDDELFMTVDGVENVIGGKGDDGVYIDETEAGKNNLISLGEGDDIVLYGNAFDGGDDSNSGEVPSVKLIVNFATDTDRVEMTGGRVGLDKPFDTLVDVEAVSFAVDDDNLDAGEDGAGGAASSSSEIDVLDVSHLSGATVDFTNGHISTGGSIPNGGATQLIVYGMSQFETVTGSSSSDTVIVDDVMFNSREDSADGLDAVDVTFDSFMNYDMFNDMETDGDKDTNFMERMSIADLRKVGTSGADVNPWGQNDIPEALNIAQFEFNLGAGTADTVDYYDETGTVVAVVVPGQTPSRVLVSHDQLGDGDAHDLLLGDGDRVDLLTGVERIVAAQGESILDFTAANQDVQIDFQYSADLDAGDTVEDGDVIETTVRIADHNGNIITGLSSMVERYVVGGTNATWNRIEGSDFDEKVSYDGSEDLVNQPELDHRYSDDTLNLRGGDNVVSYYKLETSITAVLDVTAFDVDDPFNTGLVNAEISFQDGDGGSLNGNTHTISSFTADNELNQDERAAANRTNTLKIEASQDAEDTVSFNFDDPKFFVLGASPGVMQVRVGDVAGSVASVTLTGFERLLDADTDDVYDLADYDQVFGDLELVDNDPLDRNDRDTVKVASRDYSNGATVSLEDINDDFLFDFDVLDITNLTKKDLIIEADTDGARDITGDGVDDSGSDPDDVIVGKLSLLDSVTGFGDIYLTNASVAEEDAYTLDLDAAELQDGTGDLIFPTDATGLNFSMVTTTGGVTVEVVDTGAVGAHIVGSVGVDTIVGAEGDDVLEGGAGADTLDGSFIPAEGATLTLTLAGVGADGGTEAGSGAVYIAGLHLYADATPELADETDYGDGADADQIGAAAAGVSLATWRLALDGAGLTTAEASALNGVAYDPVTNELTFTFDASLDGSSITALDLTGANSPHTDGDAALTVSETATGYVPEGNSADTYVYSDKGDSTASAMDHILHFDDSDTIDFSGVNPDTLSGLVDDQGIVDFDTFDAADWLDGNGDFEIVVASDGENGRVFADVDGDGDVDMVIELVGETTTDDFDALVDYGI